MSYEEEHTPSDRVNEPMVAYNATGRLAPFYYLLGLKPTAPYNDFEIVKLAREGFPKKVLLMLANKISISLQELANIMHISERTLQRYDDDTIIKTEYAEKAVELARLYARGAEVFGSAEKFKLWIKYPSLVFNGEAPVSLLDTSIGFDMVFKELGRIEHGIFA